LLVLLTLAALAALGFGLRTYGSFVLLSSAYQVGAPDVSGVRPWMTVGYVARSYRVPELALLQRLGLPSNVDPSTTLKSIARSRGLSPFRYVQEAQEAVSDLRRLSPVPARDAAGSRDSVGDEFLAALLVYGYPVLGLTLFLGALGAHLPSALAMVVAGSLAAQGHMSWVGASAVGLSGSVLGDVTGYSLGRALGQEFLERWGGWVGLTPARRARVEILFQRWGALSVVLSRSLLSFLSPAVSVLAGAGRYPLRRFLPFGVVGRLIWTSAYLGLGYSLGASLEAAADFLSGLSGLLFSLAALAGLGFLTYRNHARVRDARSARRRSPFDLAEILYDLATRRSQPRSAAVVIRNLQGGPRGGRVLDLGAGTGRVAMDVEASTGTRVTACDVDLPALTTGHPSITGGIVGADGQALPFESGSFAAVYLVYVLHHVADQVRVLAEVRRVLEDGGRIVLVEFDARSSLVRLFRLLARATRRRCSFHAPGSLVALLKAAGFDAEIAILDRATFVVKGVRKNPRGDLGPRSLVTPAALISRRAG